ncbi:hypothetical protein IAT38_002095 [Cryptococcus sp. DSM 104549]
MAPLALLQPKLSSSSTLEAFLDRHQQLLELEKKAEEEQTRLLNSKCSPRLLEQRGLALSGLGVSGISIGLGGKSLIELHRPLAYHTSTALPPHTFRSGDVVRVEAHVSSSGAGKSKGKKKEGEDESAVEGVVYRVGPEKVVVAVDGSKETDLPERLRLLKLANTVTFDRMETTLDHLRRLVLPKPDSPTPRAINFPLIQVLLGIELPDWEKDIPASQSAESEGEVSGSSGAGVQWFDGNLNDSQKEAIEFCLKAKQVACIHGPPGTGKTHTLIELIFQLLSRPAAPGTTRPPRILIATPSNLALDNLLLRLHSLAQQPPYSSLLPRDSILRIGHPTRVHRDLVKETLDWRAANGEQGELLKDVGREMQGHLSDLGKKRGDKGAVKGRSRGKKWDEVRELRKEYRQREGKVVTTVINAAQVVLATCHSAGARQLNNMIFDVCIIDEATQAVEAVCWVPILKSRKLILAGDPEQLPPTIMSKGDVSPPKKVKEKPATTPAGETPRKPKPSAAEAVRPGGEKPVESAPATQEGAAAASDPLEDEVSPGAGQSTAEIESATPTHEPAEISTTPGDGIAPTTPDSAELINQTRPAASTDPAPSPASAPKSTAAPDSTPAPDSPSTINKPLITLRLARSPPLAPPRTLETTLFERLETLYGSGIKRVLQVQYRMNEHIASFPSKTLYESRLVSDASVAKRTLLELPSIADEKKEEEDAKADLGETVVFFDTAGCEFYERTEGEGEGGNTKGAIGEGSKSNENEAEIVAKWARKLVSLGVPPAEIGIVTPYQAQVALISSMLHEEFPEMTIGSVDGLQGQEREAIILSLVRSNAVGEVGFLGEYRRLNVAMTRAKRQLCVVGDSSTVSKGSKYLKSWMTWLEAEADVRWAGDDAV